MANTPDTAPIQSSTDPVVEQGDQPLTAMPDYSVPIDENQKGEFDLNTWANQTPAEYKATQRGIARIRAAVADGKAKRGH